MQPKTFLLIARKKDKGKDVTMIIRGIDYA